MPPVTVRLQLAAFLVIGLDSCRADSPPAPVRLRVEYMPAPVGVDIWPVRFGWTAEHTRRGQLQTAYQIVVAGAQGGAGVWDSGKVASNVSQNVPWGGDTNLTADRHYQWSVRWWDRDDRVSPSSTAEFSTGLYTAADWKGAQYIGGAMGQYRKSFAAAGAVSRATLYIVGLGYYKFHMNGKLVSTHELGAFTTYTERVYYDTYNVTAAMNDAIAAGVNEQVLGVVLGNGWYSLGIKEDPTQGAVGGDPFDGGHPIAIGKPLLKLRLSCQFESGATFDLVSDTSWIQTAGPITTANLYMGETYNAALETAGWTGHGFTPGNEWSHATVANPPSAHTVLASHAVMPPIRITKSYEPCDMWQSSPGVYVFDFCQNMAGFSSLHIPEGNVIARNTSISMLHAEAIHGPPANKSAIFQHYGREFEKNLYIARGDRKAISYFPHFMYAGFRYVQLTYPHRPEMGTLKAHFVHTDYEHVGTVSFSDPQLTAVQQITRASAMSNYMSIPTDCPQRERRGWLGDAQLSAETNLYNFDMAAPFTSLVDQIHDAQNHVSKWFNASAQGPARVLHTAGSVPDTVPFYGHGRQPADPAWGAAYTLLPEWVDKWFRDETLFARHYDGIKLHIDQLVNTASQNKMDGLLSYGLYSDWCPPVVGCSGFSAGSKQQDPSGLNPPSDVSNSKLVSSFYYIQQLRIIIKYAERFGKFEDRDRYAAILRPLPDAFNRHFFDATNKTYKEVRWDGYQIGQQTTISLAWHLGVIPVEHKTAVIQTLVDDVASSGWHLNVGIVGIKFLLPTLSEAGRGDVALMVAKARTPPSYIYMVEQGATTLWETWESTRYVPGGSARAPAGHLGVPSWNHIMFGSISEWYFKHLAGIQQQEDSHGWEKIRLQPQVWIPARNISICGNLSSANSSVITSRGVVEARWACGSATEHLNRDVAFSYTIQVPVGASAAVHLPTMGYCTQSYNVSESGTTVWTSGKFVAGSASGIIEGQFEAATGEVVLIVGSGRYAFQVARNQRNFI